MYIRIYTHMYMNAISLENNESDCNKLKLGLQVSEFFFFLYIFWYNKHIFRIKAFFTLLAIISSYGSSLYDHLVMLKDLRKLLVTSAIYKDFSRNYQKTHW